MDENGKKIWEKTGDEADMKSSLADLTRYVYLHYGVKPWLLIDEYDTPLNSAYLKGYISDLTEFMRNFFSASLKDNQYLEKGVMTGILRVSKDSMLSGLNNLHVYTILDKKTYNPF